VPERSVEGLQAGQAPGTQRVIPRAHAQLTAFVGRTLRGPVNRSMLVRSFTDYQRQFGGLWQPSPLSYAIEQFFEQGGQRAVIVRVANGAAPVTLSLRCGRETLCLEARAPGTREFLRASVDYDHIDPADQQRFNLVVQRVRSPGSERIEEQETFRGLSVDPTAQRHVATVLLESELVRVRGAVPAVRPERTLMPGTNLPVGYVSSNPDGDDGQPVTDYDVIGSAVRGSGLFALEGVDELAFLCIPPLARTVDIGVSTLLAAARLCRSQRIMLIVDPPAAWDTPGDAVQALNALNFHSDNAVMFFPRIAAVDRLRGRMEVFANCGVVAGLLSRSGEAVSAALAAADPQPLLRAGARLAREVGVTDRWLLAAHGVNVLQTVRSPQRNGPSLRTLACGASTSSDWSYLSQRRFALFTINAIERGTRWCLLEPVGPPTWQRVTQQIRTFLGELRSAGAFASAPADQAFLVVCDERINRPDDPRTVNILVQFAALHAGEYHSVLITHAVQGSSVRQVAVNRLEASLIVSHELQQELTIRLKRGERPLVANG
jgi:Bacteriophage tail sheath protein